MPPKDGGGPPGGGPDANAKAANNGNSNAHPYLFDAITDPYLAERTAMAATKAHRATYLAALGLHQPGRVTVEELRGIWTVEQVYAGGDN